MQYLDFRWLDQGWTQQLAASLNNDTLFALDHFLCKEVASGVEVYPPRAETFQALELTRWANVQVVILGQDPYHQPGQAHGLSFSVRPGVRVPPSLQNIYKAQRQQLGTDHGGSTGCLRTWAQQGVLLLNTVLSVRANQAASHRNQGWEWFTDQVIKALNEHPQDVAFLLWGSHAQRKQSLITQSRHLILQAPHPSPLSAHRGFFEAQHFSKVNDWLKAQGRAPIDWRVTQPERAFEHVHAP